MKSITPTLDTRCRRAQNEHILPMLPPSIADPYRQWPKKQALESKQKAGSLAPKKNADKRPRAYAARGRAALSPSGNCIHKANGRKGITKQLEKGPKQKGKHREPERGRAHISRDRERGHRGRIGIDSWQREIYSRFMLSCTLAERGLDLL